MSSSDFLSLKRQWSLVKQAVNQDERGLSRSLGLLPLGTRNGDGLAHLNAPSSVCGNSTTAEAGKGASLPRGGAVPAAEMAVAA